MKTFLAVMLLSCLAFAQNDAAIAKAKAACGPDDIKFDVKNSDASQPPAGPENGKALVYVINLATQADSCIHCGNTARVGMDGAWAGATHGNSYLTLNVAPGEHHLCTQLQSRFAAVSRYVALANFTAEAGKVYYFRMRGLVNQTEAFLDLDPVNTDQGQYLVATSKMSESKQKKP
jgi:hypothetical protein